jgi:hypothetical protein
VPDERPDLENGRPINYSIDSRHAHQRHVHGGWLPSGLTMVYNGTGEPEMVRTEAEDA